MKDTEPEDETHKPAYIAPALLFDWEDWREYLDDCDIPDDQKRELIETLWAIVTGFVDFGFGLNPTQQICGETIDLKAVLEAAVLSSDEANNEDRKEGVA